MFLSSLQRRSSTTNVLNRRSHLMVEALEDRCQPSVFTVTNTDDSGAGSLRQAILNANSNPGADAIHFRIGSGSQTIIPASALPDVTDTVTINATTQPGYEGSPLIVLKGASSGQAAYDGLTLKASDCVIRGLVINRFANGITIRGSGATGNLVAGNYIGTGISGTNAQPNAQHGVRILNARNNTIGGSAAAGFNLISGNLDSGVVISGSGATGNRAQNNLIGLTVSGTAALPNGDAGVVISSGAQNNTIGAGNVISGNAASGIRIAGNATSGNVVEGSLIGTTPSGLEGLGNGARGIYINGAPNNRIGGTTAAARNVIAANGSEGTSWTGILIANSGAEGNVVQGNYVGVGVDGTTPLPQPGRGIRIGSNANNNLIGGTVPGAGNLVGANGGLNRIGRVDSVVVDDWDGNEHTGTPGVGNAIRRNSILENQLGVNGIALAPGANHDQAPPALEEALRSAGTVDVTGSLSSTPNTAFVVEFFASPDGSPPEGRTFLGDLLVTTDGAGNASIQVTLETAGRPGRFITATATNLSTNDTSGFSAAVPVRADDAAPTSDAIGARLISVKIGNTRRLMVQVYFADTGARKSRFLAPFQKPQYKSIRVTVRDSDGDGVTDEVVVTARKGSQTLTRTFID